jgi:hypothetical protein
LQQDEGALRYADPCWFSFEADSSKIEQEKAVTEATASNSCISLINPVC